MDLDPVLLARIQFAFTVTFHIIFPSFTIGLAAFIATLLVRWRLTGRDHLHRLARFCTKIFAVSFAMGVVSGIVLSYQFGTNWSNFSVVVGNVLASFAHLRSTRDRDWAARFVEFIRASDYRQRRDGNIVYLAPMRGREALIV